MGVTTSSQICRLCQEKGVKLQQCTFCQKFSCHKCWDFPIIVPEPNKHFSDWKYCSGCVECFKSRSTLNFEQQYEVIGQENEKQIIFLHGAGSCRKMFEPHAVKLAEKGFRSVLVDLPGHGSRMAEKLDLSTSMKVIKEALGLCKTKKVTIIGGSLGGYILMQALGSEPGLCWKAVVMMSGQNVGVGRSVKASLGLWFLNKSMRWLSQGVVANAFLVSTSKNKHLDRDLISELLKGGIYFKHGQQNVRLLETGNYQASLYNLNEEVPILFINGEKDHRDSEKVYLQAAGKRSKLIDYEGADHFFSHDVRFMDRLVEDIAAFVDNQGN